MIPTSPVSFEVVIPTRDRPAKLGRCLAALAEARAAADLPVLVCDSSDEAHFREVEAICAEYPFVTLKRHRGDGVAAARNFCAREARADALIGVDDDVRVEPEALTELIKGYLAQPQPGIVAGAVAWDGVYSRPVVIREVGYGRPARESEAPSFLITALFAFPRQLALDLPWNERLKSSDDIFVGALWRSYGVLLGYAPSARATHDSEHHFYGVEDQGSLIYTNLFDALIANPCLRRAFSYEFLGFAAGAKLYFRRPSTAWRYVAAWINGNWSLARDWSYLRQLVRRELPQSLAATPR